MSVHNTAAPRLATVEGITGLRLYPHGAAARLVNMSSTGLLAEATTKISVDSVVTVGFEGGFTPSTAPGRVARCEVASMGPDGLRYHIGIEFVEAIPLAAGDARTPAVAPIRNRW